MELPVIATRIPGCVDAVREGETGLLVPVRDTEALTAAIRMYLRDPNCDVSTAPMPGTERCAI